MKSVAARFESLRSREWQQLRGACHQSVHDVERGARTFVARRPWSAMAAAAVAGGLIGAVGGGARRDSSPRSASGQFTGIARVILRSALLGGLRAAKLNAARMLRRACEEQRSRSPDASA
jgi:hypothetical protein